MRSSGGWSAESSPSSSRSAPERWTTARSRRPWPLVYRPSTEPRLRRGDSVSVASSSDGGRSDKWESTRNDEREDLHGPRERDRSALVRRRRDRRDARAPRVADRARPRGQAQADLVAEPRLGRSRDRPERITDRRDERQAREQALHPAQRVPAGLPRGDARPSPRA